LYLILTYYQNIYILKEKLAAPEEKKETTDGQEKTGDEKKEGEDKGKEENKAVNPIPEQSAVAKSTVLIDNDHELEVVKGVLKNIHKTYYDSYDKKEENISVQNIMKNMRHKVLGGKNILFSSVIPLNQDPYTTDIWNLTILFGGNPYTAVKPELTHVVAGKVIITYMLYIIFYCT